MWNNPAVGRVEFADNATRWTATQARGIDYFLTAGSPAQILARYADATGHAPRLPVWASGFWQSKLRYLGQEELLEVAREHRRRGLPLSVVVADFFHWTAMGDYTFDPAAYPDPRAMMRELEEMGVRLNGLDLADHLAAVRELPEAARRRHAGGNRPRRRVPRHDPRQGHGRADADRVL